MRNARADAPASRFLGVRLTAEEEALLDQFRERRHFSNRSEAVRAVVREASTERPRGIELPPTVLGELEELVELGYAPSLDAALSALVQLGLSELTRTHGDGWASLREHARSTHSRREDRKRADREGRGLLRR